MSNNLISDNKSNNYLTSLIVIVVGSTLGIFVTTAVFLVNKGDSFNQNLELKSQLIRLNAEFTVLEKEYKQIKLALTKIGEEKIGIGLETRLSSLESNINDLNETIAL